MTPNQPEPQDELLLSFQRDEPGANQRVFDCYYNSLFYFALKITGSRQDAQDIVQEVFIKLIEGRPGRADIENLGGFLFTMTRNAAINYVQRDKKKYSTRSISDNIPIHDENILEKEMYRAWLLRELNKEIELLPAEERAVMKLLLQRKSPTEIAVLLGRSPQTVRNQKTSAINKLKGRLPKDGFLWVLLLFSIIKDG